MTDKNDRKDDMPKADNGTEAAKEAELLKPEVGKAEKKEKPVREPRTLEGQAEEVKENQNERPVSSEVSTGSGTTSLFLAAGLSSVGGAAIAVAALWGLGAIGQSSSDDLSSRLAALEAGQNVSAPADNGNAEAQADAIASLQSRLGEMEARLADAAATEDGAAGIDARFDALSQDLQNLKATLNDTRATSQALQEETTRLAAAMPPSGIAEQISGLDALVKALDLRIGMIAPEISKMEARVIALEEKKEDPDAAARAALGLALANLARISETSSPFAAELNAVSTFLPDEAGIAALSEAATKGVPTRAALEARFPSVVSEIFAAERRVGEENLWSRFVSNAKSLITVRRTGEISGDTTEAIVARMESRLKLDDLAGAVGEGKKLSGPAAEAAAGWLLDADTRLQTDDLLRDLTARVTGQLAAMKG